MAGAEAPGSRLGARCPLHHSASLTPRGDADFLLHMPAPRTHCQLGAPGLALGAAKMNYGNLTPLKLATIPAAVTDQ